MIRRLALVAVLAVVGASCSNASALRTASLTSPATSGRTANGGGGLAPSGIDAVAGTSGGQTVTGPAAPVQTSASTPTSGGRGGSALRLPVSAKTIRFGFVSVINNQKVRAAYGVGNTDFGDDQEQIKAVVDDINASGGINGRKLQLFVHTLDEYSADSQDSQLAAICQGLTQDDHVFAVAGQVSSPEFDACLSRAGVINVVDSTEMPDAGEFRAFAPHLASGIFSQSRGAVAYAKGLVESGFVTKQSRLGVMLFDLPAYHHIDDEYFKPTLRAFGIRPATEYAIVRGDFSSINSAVLHFKTENIDRVAFVDAAGGNALFFMTFAQSQDYHPRYGIASWDAPTFLAQNVPDTQMDGAVAVGWIPAGDALDAQSPPLTRGERKCLSVMDAHGQHFADRFSALTAMLICDATWVFRDAAVGAGSNLTVKTWAAALAKIGRSHISAATHLTDFVPGRPDGAIGYRTLAYDSSCKCMKYTSPVRTIDR
jgi:ABC-type branched-subunit amino acid transport system substrate-binding protein